MKGLSQWIILIWGISFLLLILNLAISIRNVDKLIDNEQDIAHSREVSRALRALTTSTLNAETGQRGFQITGEDKYLDPYRAAEAALPEQIATLREVVVGDRYHSERVVRLLELTEQKFKELRFTIALRKLVGRETTRHVISQGIGSGIMTEIRGLSQEMLDREEGVLNERSVAAQAGYRSAKNTALLGGLLTLGTIAIAFAMIRKELGRRQEAEREARQTAEDLAHSQRRMADTLALLDAFLNNAPIGMAFFNRDLMCLRVNDLYARATAEHPGQAVPESTSPQVLADLRRVLNEAVPILDRKVTGRRGMPDKVWMSSYFPVIAGDGRALGVGEVTLDVTEELAAETRLRRSESRKSAILETALDAVISLDQDGNVIEFNPAAEKIFGYTRAEMLGRDMATMIVPSIHREGHHRGLAHFLVTGEGPVLNRRIELQAVRKGGEEFPAELAITATVAADGTTFTAYLRDITEAKKVAETLRNSEQRFRTLTETIPQMIWNADATGRITYVNQRCSDYSGLTLGVEMPSWWRDIAHPDDAALLERAWQGVLNGTADEFEVEARLRDVADGEYHWFATALVPLRTATGAVDQWIGAASPIDAQKRQSEILASLVKMRTAELEATNALLQEEIGERTRVERHINAQAVELGRSNEELEKFAYVASHDLQEPLRKIQQFGDRLLKRFSEPLGPDGQDYVARMNSAATRMRRLIDDLLTFSRVTSKGVPFGQVNLQTLVGDVLSDLEARVTQTEGRVEVVDLPTIAADALQMRQLFQNLIGNALKFHRPGVPPVVTIRATAWSRLGSDAAPALPSDEGWRITVADNGIGFKNEYAERIFEVFQRLHGRGEYEGTGIGLAICRKIVQRHGGSIRALSQEGEGTSFVIDLPLMTE